MNGYVATTSSDFKEKHYFSRFDPKHQELLQSYIIWTADEVEGQEMGTMLAKIEERLLSEGIVLGQAQRLEIFDAVWDYLDHE